MKLVLFILSYSVFILQCASELVQIDQNNLEGTLKDNQIVFINFYADWCRFSRMLAPIFQEAADLVSKDPHLGQPGVVQFAKVDCDAQGDIARKYNVNKYPTMKLFRNGQMMKKEYRGQRSSEKLLEYVREQMKDPIKQFQNLDEVYDIRRDVRNIVGYFAENNTAEYKVFEAVAKILQDDCHFHAGFGEVSKPERTSGDNVIFKPIGELEADDIFLSSLSNLELFKSWAKGHCVPLVREITFSNGEELTEEGLPFLILFHIKEDEESLEVYKREVSFLVDLKNGVNFLVADCETFSHPLHHLGKSVKDCPLVAIDSFKHMYLFPKFEDITVKGKLRQFVSDLHSGKLHREFHHGPDPSVTATTQKPQQVITEKKGFHKGATTKPPKVQVKIQTNAQPGVKIDSKKPDSPSRPSGEPTEKKTNEDDTTVKSIFVNMKPSEHRYTLLDNKDEL